MNYLFLLLLTVALGNYCQAQIKPCQNHITAELDNKPSVTKEDGPGQPGKLKITFENGFSDSAIVLINSKIVFRDKLVTSKSLGRCSKYVEIDYFHYKQLPRISVVLNSGECMYFYPEKKKKRAYINRGENNKWSVLLTNDMHIYF